MATAFVDALETAYDRLGRHPGIGSLRYAHELGLPGLRSWQLKDFPYTIFYVEGAKTVDVWRVLHAHRHVPAWAREPIDAPDVGVPKVLRGARRRTK